MFLVLVLLSAYLLVFRCELKGSIWIILRTISVLQKKKKKRQRCQEIIQDRFTIANYLLDCYSGVTSIKPT